MLFADTFTSHVEPEIGVAAFEVLDRAGIGAALAPHVCCGRPLISQGLLREARDLAAAQRRGAVPARVAWSGDRVRRAELPLGGARGCARPAGAAHCARRPRSSPGTPCCSRSTSSAKSAPAGRRCRWLTVRPRCCCTSTVTSGRWASARLPRRCSGGYRAPRSPISMPAAAAWPARSAIAAITTRCRRPSASGSCCRPRGALPAGGVLAAAGTSCRHQVAHFTGVQATHPAVLIRSLLEEP